MSFLEPKLREITMPALVVQGNNDPVVNPSGSERLYNLLGSQNKRYELFNFDRHGILNGKNSDLVHQAVGQFVDQLAQVVTVSDKNGTQPDGGD